MCDVVKDTSDSKSLWDTLNLFYAAVFGQPTVEKCILDPLAKPSLTGTASENNESSMAMNSRYLVYMNSTFDSPIDLPTTPNDSIGLIHGDHLLPSDSNIPLSAHGLPFLWHLPVLVTGHLYLQA